MEWFSSTELMGVAGLPKTDRQLRNIIKELSLRTPEKVRQRAGSKASEVHISLLPPSVQAALWRRQGLIEVNGKLLQLPKEKSAEKKERYCKEEVWSRWNKATTDQQARARKCAAAFAALSAAPVGVSDRGGQAAGFRVMNWTWRTTLACCK